MPRHLLRIVSISFLLAIVLLALFINSAAGEVSTQPLKVPTIKAGEELMVKMRKQIVLADHTRQAYNATSTTTTLKVSVTKKVGAIHTAAAPTPPSNYQYLAPCITGYESGGGIIGHKDYTAQNPTSSASGEGQWTDGTWNNWGGYAHAKDAPTNVQDDRLAHDLGLSLSHIQHEWAAQRSRCHF